jgi:methionyl-tRNA formyltransferase
MSIDLNKIKVIFLGTPEFSVPILNSLIENYNVVAVVTQPDKKVGRKQEIVPAPIKKVALANEIEILQPESVTGNSEFIRSVTELKPDLIVVAAYGFILPQEILDIPKFGVINVHASLLPKLRGASPIQSAIMNGDDKTGVTIMLVNQKMDEGDILSQAESEINNDETFPSLHDKLSILGTHLLIDTLPNYISGEIKSQKQDDSQASYCQLISKEDGKIEWNKSAEEIERQVRALNPWPGTWTIWGNKKLKIISADISDVQDVRESGHVDNDLVVKCGKEGLKLKELQLEGKKVMTAKEFLNGYKNIIGQILK